MKPLTFEVSEEVLSAVRHSPDRFLSEMRLAAAIHWYSQGQVSQETAAAVAGLNRRDFLEELARQRIEAFQVDFDDLKTEVDRG